MAWGDFKDLPRRTTSDKILQKKDLILLKIQNMMDVKYSMVSVVYTASNKRSCGFNNSGGAAKIQSCSN